MKKIWLLSTLLVAGLLLTGCNKTCTDDCLPEDWEKNNQIQCGNVYDPICWEDWKVYSNWCYLNVAGAHWDETLWVKNDECFKITKESLYWKYILTRYNDNHNVRDNHNIELNISADWIFAKFCNHLGTSNYSLSWNILTVEEMSQTEMACEWENWEWLMNAEREFNLNDARVTLSEDNLTISTSRWAQYQFQISDDYNQFLEAIKSSWEQPQGKNNLIIPAFDDINKVVDKCGDDSYDYNVYQKDYILPYKDWYIWYQLWWQDGWELYLTYRKLGEPCNIISQSDNIFWWNPYYKEWQETFRWASYPDNKIYIAQWLFSWVPTEEIVKELNCIPGNNFEDHDHTCMKEAEKYFYDLIVWNEENEYFTQWMNKLKEDIDNEDYKTFSYYRVEYDTCSQKVVDLIWALQPNQDEKARWEYQVKRTENMHKCVLENLNK
jgi:heat shock protein HslJ